MTMVTLSMERSPIDRNPYARLDYPSSDDNFSNLIENWEHYNDRIILFLGAGASIGAYNVEGKCLPSAYELRNQLWSKFMLSEEERISFDFNNLGLMSLEHAASLAEAKVDIATVKRYTASYFETREPLWQHCVLPFLGVKALFTTNYDSLIEDAWNRHKQTEVPRKIRPIYKNEDLNPQFVPLYKPHGSIECPTNKIGEGGIVLTQFDYFEIMNERRAMLSNLLTRLQDCCVIFIGYGLSDTDIASQLYSMRRRDSGPRWYAVFPRDNKDVRNMYNEKYGIRQINRSFHDFFVDLDKAVNFIPQAYKEGNIGTLIDNKLIADHPWPVSV